MIRDNIIVFCAICLSVFAVCGKVLAHPFYVSVTEIRADSQKMNLSISCRMFTDDLESALNQLYKRPFDLQRSTGDTVVSQLLNDYIQNRFSMGINGSMQRFMFLGFEKEDESTWCYLESENFEGLGTATVTNRLLYDFLPDQVNIIHLYLNGERQSTRLVNPEKTAGFTLR